MNLPPKLPKPQPGEEGAPKESEQQMTITPHPSERAEYRIGDKSILSAEPGVRKRPSLGK